VFFLEKNKVLELFALKSEENEEKKRKEKKKTLNITKITSSSLSIILKKLMKTCH